MAVTTGSVLAAVPTAEPGGDTVLLWPKGTPGAKQVTAKEILSERAPDGPLRDRFAAARHASPDDAVPRQRQAQRHHAAHRPGRRLCARGHRQGRLRGGRVVHRSAASTAAVLRYRLPADGWAAGPDAPVHDAMRALRLLRASRARRRRHGRRIGVIGFSAGGHLIARLITEPALAYPRRDAADDAFRAPGFRGAHVSGDRDHRRAARMRGSAQQLLGRRRRSHASSRATPPNLHVGAHTPPTLLVHAADDHQRARRELAADVRRVAQGRRAQRAARVRPRRARLRPARRRRQGRRRVAARWLQNWALANATPLSVRLAPAATC